MQPTTPIVDAESMLNEADFLAELAMLDDGMTAKPRPAAALAYEPLQGPTAAVRTTPAGRFAEEAYDASAEDSGEGISAPGQIAAAAMFVLMMGVGAAGAAVVFHTQVARILATLRIQ